MLQRRLLLLLFPTLSALLVVTVLAFKGVARKKLRGGPNFCNF